jgi:hypothetical protein
MAGDALFPIVVKDAAFHPPPAAAYYVVAANGLFLVRDTPLFSATVPVDRGVPGLQEQDAGLRLCVPRLPRVLVAAALGFFRDVYQRWRGEAILIMFYDPAQGRFAFRAPPQRITGRVEHGRFRADLRLDYRACDRPGTGYVKLGTFHSHGNAGPWHSSIDIHDELYEAGLHITAGYVDSPRPEFAAAFVVGRTRFTVPVADVLPSACAARRPPRSWIAQVTLARERWGRATPRGSAASWRPREDADDDWPAH